MILGVYLWFMVFHALQFIDKINIVNIGAKLVCSIVWQLMHLLGNLKVPDKILAQCTKTLCVCVMKGIGNIKFCQSKQLEQPAVLFKTRELLKVAFITFSGVVC